MNDVERNRDGQSTRFFQVRRGSASKSRVVGAALTQHGMEYERPYTGPQMNLCSFGRGAGVGASLARSVRAFFRR